MRSWHHESKGRKIFKVAVSFFLLGLILSFVCFLVWMFGSSNPYTPAGYVGYVTQGAVFGEKTFYGVQKGPSSPGRMWLGDVINVSVTPYTFTEVFAGESSVLSKDRLAIEFSIHITFKIDSSKVKEFVENYSYGDSDDDSDERIKLAYAHFMKEPLRTFARDEVQALDGMEIASQISRIGAAVQDKACLWTKDSPFIILSVVVGNIQFPAIVTSAVSNKLAAKQRLEQQQTEVEIAKQQAQIRIESARGIAEAMRIINERLTNEYLQHEAIEAQSAMANSPNHTTVYIPVGSMGIPLVGNVSLDQPAR